MTDRMIKLENIIMALSNEIDRLTEENSELWKRINEAEGNRDEK